MSKRYFILGVVLVMLLAALVFMFSGSFGNQFNEGKVDREVSIRWDMVNVRENHSTSSEIITSLPSGQTVTLTGNSYEYFSAEDIPTESWTEIKLSDGKIGWVVTRSIKW